MYTRTTPHPHNTHALTNERSYAQDDQYTHHDQSPPNQYTRRTLTTVTTPNQYTITHTPPRTLIRVSDARGRVLSSNATAKTTTRSTSANGATAPSTYDSRDSDTALLCINEYAIEQRFAQFTKAVAGKPSTRRRDSASLLFGRFLQSRVAGGPAHMVTANPTT